MTNEITISNHTTELNLSHTNIESLSVFLFPSSRSQPLQIWKVLSKLLDIIERFGSFVVADMIFPILRLNWQRKELACNLKPRVKVMSINVKTERDNEIYCDGIWVGQLWLDCYFINHYRINTFGDFLTK